MRGGWVLQQQHLPGAAPLSASEMQFGMRLQQYCGAELVQTVLSISGPSHPNPKWLQIVPRVACWAHRDIGV